MKYLDYLNYLSTFEGLICTSGEIKEISIKEIKNGIMNGTLVDPGRYFIMDLKIDLEDIDQDSYKIPSQIIPPSTIKEAIKEINDGWTKKLISIFYEIAEDDRCDIVQDLFEFSSNTLKKIYFLVSKLNMISPGYKKYNFPEFYFRNEDYGGAVYRIINKINYSVKLNIVKKLKNKNRFTKENGGFEKIKKLIEELGEIDPDFKYKITGDNILELGDEIICRINDKPDWTERKPYWKNKEELEELPWDLTIPYIINSIDENKLMGTESYSWAKGVLFKSVYLDSYTTEDIISAYEFLRKLLNYSEDLSSSLKEVKQCKIMDEYFNNIGLIEKILKEHITEIPTNIIKIILTTMRK